MRKSPGLTDELQEKCIARAREMRLTPYALDIKTGGKVSQRHIEAFLERRCSLSSHKLQHLLKALDLELK